MSASKHLHTQRGCLLETDTMFSKQFQINGKTEDVLRLFLHDTGEFEFSDTV